MSVAPAPAKARIALFVIALLRAVTGNLFLVYGASQHLEMPRIAMFDDVHLPSPS